MRCKMVWMARLDDAIKWQADLIEAFFKVDRRLETGMILHEALDLLECGILMRVETVSHMRQAQKAGGILS